MLLRHVKDGAEAIRTRAGVGFRVGSGCDWLQLIAEFRVYAIKFFVRNGKSPIRTLAQDAEDVEREFRTSAALSNR